MAVRQTARPIRGIRPDLAVAAGRAAAPVVLAGERLLAVPGALGAVLPGGGLQRGTVTVIDGVLGAGRMSVALRLVAAATAVGEWAAVVDDGTVGAVAAGEAGAELSRVAVVRAVPRDQWAIVVAALLEGITVVVAPVPAGVRSGDARRLAARARERGAVLVAVGPWPVEAALRLHAAGGRWRGLGAGDGLLADRAIEVQVGGRRVGRPAVVAV
jgi:hypothetical protein